MCVCVCVLVTQMCLFVTPQIIAHQAPVFMEFSRQEYWSGLPFPSPGDLPDPGIEPRSPTLQADSLLSGPPRKPWWATKALAPTMTYLGVTLPPPAPDPCSHRQAPNPSILSKYPLLASTLVQVLVSWFPANWSSYHQPWISLSPPEGCCY